MPPLNGNGTRMFLAPRQRSNIHHGDDEYISFNIKVSMHNSFNAHISEHQFISIYLNVQIGFFICSTIYGYQNIVKESDDDCIDNAVHCVVCIYFPTIMGLLRPQLIPFKFSDIMS